MFNTKDEKALKQSQKEKEMFEKYGLTTLTDPADIASAKAIVNSLASSQWSETGMSLQLFGKSPEQYLPVYYQHVLIEQNFIIIRQLEKLLATIKKPV